MITQFVGLSDLRTSWATRWESIWDRYLTQTFWWGGENLSREALDSSSGLAFSFGLPRPSCVRDFYVSSSHSFLCAFPLNCNTFCLRVPQDWDSFWNLKPCSGWLHSLSLCFAVSKSCVEMMKHLLRTLLKTLLKTNYDQLYLRRFLDCSEWLVWPKGTLFCLRVSAEFHMKMIWLFLEVCKKSLEA